MDGTLGDSNSEDLGYFKKILNKRPHGPLPSLNSMVQLILEFSELVFGFTLGIKYTGVTPGNRESTPGPRSPHTTRHSWRWPLLSLLLEILICKMWVILASPSCCIYYKVR